MNNVLIILGMHRSGTSLLSNWLYEMGLNVGNNLIGKSKSNQKGHFEDIDFHNIHEKILRENNISYGGFFNINSKIKVSSLNFEMIKNLIEQRNDANINWGWKEPRTCLFLDVYNNLLPEASIIVTYRHYSHVVNSLLVRHFKHVKFKGFRKIFAFIPFLYRYIYKKRYLNKYLLSYCIYNKNILDLLKQKKSNQCIVVNLDSIITNEKKIVKLINNWGFELKFRPFEKIYDEKLLTSIVPNLNFDVNLRDEADKIFNELEKYSL